jgi:hypothetical protein
MPLRQRIEEQAACLQLRQIAAKKSYSLGCL